MDEPTSGDVAWLIMASALIWLMLPGVGFFYSGLTGHKSALSLIMLSFIAMSVATLQGCVSYLCANEVVLMGLFIDIFDNRK